MGDIILTVLAARRRRLLESDRVSLTRVGAEVSREIRAVAAFAERNKIPVGSLTLGEAEAEALAESCSIAPTAPAVVFAGSEVLVPPTLRSVARRLALDIAVKGDEVFDVLVGGGGPAGVAAGVDAGAAMLRACRAGHMHVLVRGTSLAASMSTSLLSRLQADPHITLHDNTELAALHGEGALSGVSLRHCGLADLRHQPAAAVLIMVGAAPNTSWLSGLVALDNKGFVLTGEAAGATTPHATSCPGIFAVGHVRTGSVKRVASAVGEGSVAISAAWAHVNGLAGVPGPHDPVWRSSEASGGTSLPPTSAVRMPATGRAWLSG